MSRQLHLHNASALVPLFSIHCRKDKIVPQHMTSLLGSNHQLYKKNKKKRLAENIFARQLYVIVFTPNISVFVNDSKHHHELDKWMYHGPLCHLILQLQIYCLIIKNCDRSFSIITNEHCVNELLFRRDFGWMDAGNVWAERKTVPLWASLTRCLYEVSDCPSDRAKTPMLHFDLLELSNNLKHTNVTFII